MTPDARLAPPPHGSPVLRAAGPERLDGRRPWGPQRWLQDRLRVELAPGAPVDLALRELTRRVAASGLSAELRRRLAYESPGQRRRRKRRAAQERSRRRARRRAEGRGAAARRAIDPSRKET